MLLPRVNEELTELLGETQMSKTDLVNRAISLYRLVEDARSEGKTLAFAKRGSDELELVYLL